MPLSFALLSAVGSHVCPYFYTLGPSFDVLLLLCQPVLFIVSVVLIDTQEEQNFSLWTNCSRFPRLYLPIAVFQVFVVFYLNCTRVVKVTEDTSHVSLSLFAWVSVVFKLFKRTGALANLLV